jgi:hypothetical protein
MRHRIEDNKKRKTISISIDRELNSLIEEKTTNKSMYISWMIIEKLKELNIDVSKIKL